MAFDFSSLMNAFSTAKSAAGTAPVADAGSKAIGGALGTMGPRMPAQMGGMEQVGDFMGSPGMQKIQDLASMAAKNLEAKGTEAAAQAGQLSEHMQNTMNTMFKSIRERQSVWRNPSTTPMPINKSRQPKPGWNRSENAQLRALEDEEILNRP